MIYAIKKGQNKQISEHFNSVEFHCFCDDPLCTYTLYSPVFLELMEQLRTACGNRALHVTSGFRCQSHNHNVGGKPASKHLLGYAADIYHEKMDLEEVKYRAECVGFDYVYKGAGFVHVQMNII